MTNFSAAATTDGPSDDVLRIAITTLTSNGFAITHRDAKSISLTGPGMNSSRQNPLLGASKITLTFRPHFIAADAELGGVEAMQRFLTRFPLILGLGLGLFFAFGGGLVFGQRFGVGLGVPWAQGWQWIVVAFGMAMLPVLPWFVIAPLLSRRLLRRTQESIETLVRNAAMATEPAT